MQQSDYEIVGKFGFESRTYRKISKQMIAKPCKCDIYKAFFFLCIRKKGSQCSPKAANNQRKSPLFCARSIQLLYFESYQP